jgi:uncharacterized membrane protein
MTQQQIQRIGALALIVGSLALATYAVLIPLLVPVATMATDMNPAVLSPAWRGLALCAFAGVVLMAFGFGIVYSRLYQSAGWVGFVGFLAIELAYLLQAAKVTWELFVYPVLAGNEASAFLLRNGSFRSAGPIVCFHSLASLSILVGVVLFCAAILRAREFAKAGGGLVLVGALVYGLGPLLSLYVSVAGIFTFAVGCAVLASDLWRGANQPADR